MRRSLVAIISVLVAVVSSLLGLGASTASAAATPVSWAQDVVYVYDTTASLTKADGSPVWPVRAAAERWDDANPVDYRYTTKGCPEGAQCVNVRQAELAGSTVGSAATGRSGSTIVSATVVLDTTFGRKNAAARRRNVVCHELGHALGLEHRSGTSSCMTSYVTDQRYPARADITELGRLYRAN